nr:unnamed protein product [Haemonchus contortus]
MDFEDQFEAGFDYEIQTDGVRQGAEARVYICTYLGRPAIMKERFVKKYRHPDLDRSLNKARMRNELKGLVRAHEVKKFQQREKMYRVRHKYGNKRIGLQKAQLILIHGEFMWVIYYASHIQN